MRRPNCVDNRGRVSAQAVLRRATASMGRERAEARPPWWAAVAAASLAVMLLVVGCSRATPDVEATAVALTHLWATQTAQAQPTPDVEASAQALARLWATQTAEAQPSATQTAVEPSATQTAGVSPAPTTATATQTASSTATQTSTPPPTFTHTPTSSPTPTLTSTATRTPTATPSPTPPCAIGVDGELLAAWNRPRDGCPMAVASVVWAAWEPFQHGYMLWRSDNDWTYVFNWQGGNDQNAGVWTTGGDGWRWDGISFPNGRGLTPPSGLFEPVRGFGFVWFEKLGGPSSPIGWATDQEKGFCARLQPFEQGFLFHSSSVQYCQDELYNWATAPSFPPLFLSVDQEDGSWKRY